MAQSSSDGPLVSVYESRIGAVTNTNEAVGYWTFLAGIVLGVLGLVAFALTDAATMERGIGYGMAALAPALLMTGAVLRFPLRTAATYLIGLGAAVTVAAVVWFAVIFPGGWSTSTGHTGVIATYIAGIGLIGIAGAVVPLATDPRDVRIDRLDDENAELREGRADQADLEETIADLRDDVADSEANEADLAAELRMVQMGQEQAEADLEGTIADLEDDVKDGEADQADLAAELRMHYSSRAQFEHYEDEGGQYRWRLRHSDGDVIAASNEGYGERHDAQKAIQRVRRNALGATTLLVEREAELPEAGATDGVVVPATTESQAEFELYEDTGGEYRWRLRHENGNIIAGCGEGYASRRGAASAIDHVREYVGPAEYLQPDPTAIEVYRDRGDEWRWQLVHRNGNVLASSGEGYPDRAAARGAVDELREDIGTADIEVYEDDAGGYRWRLTGEDSSIKADSEGYESRDGAEGAVERVREFMPDADLVDIGQAAFEVYQGEGDEFRWRLRHRNSNILADGREGYADRSGAWRGIESVKQNAPGADVDE